MTDVCGETKGRLEGKSELRTMGAKARSDCTHYTLDYFTTEEKDHNGRGIIGGPRKRPDLISQECKIRR